MTISAVQAQLSPYQLSIQQRTLNNISDTALKSLARRILHPSQSVTDAQIKNVFASKRLSDQDKVSFYKVVGNAEASRIKRLLAIETPSSSRSSTPETSRSATSSSSTFTTSGSLTSKLGTGAPEERLSPTQSKLLDDWARHLLDVSEVTQSFQNRLEASRHKLETQRQKQVAYFIVQQVNQMFPEHKVPSFLKLSAWQGWAADHQLVEGIGDWTVQDWLEQSEGRRAVLPNEYGQPLLRTYVDFAATSFTLRDVRVAVDALFEPTGNPHADPISELIFEMSLRLFRELHKDTSGQYFTLSEGSGTTGVGLTALHIIRKGVDHRLAQDRKIKKVVIVRTGLEHNTTKLLPASVLTGGRYAVEEWVIPTRKGSTNPDAEALKRYLDQNKGKGTLFVLTTTIASNVSSQLGERWVDEVATIIGRKVGGPTPKRRDVLWVADGAAYHDLLDLSTYQPTVLLKSPHKNVGSSTGLALFHVGDYVSLYKDKHGTTNTGLLAPAKAGGGSVTASAPGFVTYHGHLLPQFTRDEAVEFSDQLQRREGAGTPNALLTAYGVLGLYIRNHAIEKEAKAVESRHASDFFEFVRRFNEAHPDGPKLAILGDQDPANRSSIVSVNIQDKDGHDLVPSSIVDKWFRNYFGIQGRPNCNCAGDAHAVFRGHKGREIREAAQKYLNGEMPRDWGGLRVDVGLIEESQFEYVKNAFALVAEHLEEFRVLDSVVSRRPKTTTSEFRIQGDTLYNVAKSSTDVEAILSAQFKSISSKIADIKTFKQVVSTDSVSSRPQVPGVY